MTRNASHNAELLDPSHEAEAGVSLWRRIADEIWPMVAAPPSTESLPSPPYR